MKTLTLAKNLTLPLLEAVTQTIAILGKRGSGKTTTATVFVEELLAAGQHVVVIDPLDVVWGLRASRDGKAAGYPITVLGGDHADLPLEATAGAVIAEFVVEHHAPLILSLRQFSMADQRRFVTDFAERLYALKGKQAHRTALHLVIDEVDEFAAQRIPAGHERMFGAIDRLVRRGRASGIGVTMISQRAAVIHKDILSQAEVLICHQTISPQDRKALEAWIEAHDAHGQRAAFMESLAGLGRGEAWVWSPGWLDLFRRVQIRDRTTFDSSATPKAGQAPVAPKQLAAVDLAALQGRMAATIEKAKADDPRALKARIVELERLNAQALKAAQAGQRVTLMSAGISHSDEAKKQEVREILTDADRKAIDAFTVALRDATQAFLSAEYEGYHNLVPRVRDMLEDGIRSSAARADQRTKAVVERLKKVGFQRILEKLDRVSVVPPPTSSTPIRFTPERQSTSTGVPRVYGNRHAGDALPGPEQKILNAVAELEVLGLHPADKIQVGLLAGYTNVRSGGFSEPLCRLIAGGHLTSPQPGKITITDTGRAAAVVTAAPSTSDEMQARVLAKLTGPEQKLLGVLLRVYPKVLTKDQLAAACDPPYTNVRSGGFSEPLGRLNTLGIVRTPARGSVVAAPFLFLEGQ